MKQYQIELECNVCRKKKRYYTGSWEYLDDEFYRREHDYRKSVLETDPDDKSADIVTCKQCWDSISKRNNMYHCKDCKREFEVSDPVDYEFVGTSIVYTSKCDFCGGEITAGPSPRQCNFTIGNRVYAKPLHSDSLAIHPDQRVEHQRLFPDVKIDSENRPVFENYRQHDNYLEKTGFVKNAAKNESKGKTITKCN